MNHSHRRILLWLSVLFPAVCLGQEKFSHKVALGAIKEQGFYRVELTPQIVARSQRGLSDLRIYDEEFAEVPFLVNTSEAQYPADTFIDFPLKKVVPANKVLAEAENTTGIPVETLSLYIRNTDVQRYLSISGSDNGKNWFVISENIAMEFHPDARSEEFIQHITLPVSRYRYFRVTQSGKSPGAVNISKAGVFRYSAKDGLWTMVPGPEIRQKDSGNISHVSLKFDTIYQVDKLELNIKGSRFFRRRVEVYRNDDPFVVVNTMVSSNEASVIPLNARSGELEVKINNEDNAPLEISGVTAWQLARELVVYLEAGKRYDLYFGDSSARRPAYDLAYFSDSIPAALKTLEPGAIEQVVTRKATTASEAGVSRSVVWIVIIGLLLLLSIMSYKMVHEINKRKQKYPD